jgi:hypothetical protein
MDSHALMTKYMAFLCRTLSQASVYMCSCVQVAHWQLKDGIPSNYLLPENMLKWNTFFQQYNKVIQDPHQPLLVTKPKRKFGPGGKKADDRPILLLPELCYMTGMLLIFYEHLLLLEVVVTMVWWWLWWYDIGDDGGGWEVWCMVWALLKKVVYFAEFCSVL